MALGQAIAYFTSNNFIVSIPLNDSQYYDLIIEKNGIFQSVQVKYTSEIKTNNGYYCCLKTTSGTSRKQIYNINEKGADLLFCYCENGEKYLIPVSELKNNSTYITLSKNRSKYSNKKSLDTSKFFINQ